MLQILNSEFWQMDKYAFAFLALAGQNKSSCPGFSYSP
jgi:hypothetical protein